MSDQEEQHKHKQTIINVDSDEPFAYRCNVCELDFSIIEELLAHVTESHTNPNGSVSCTDCQETLSNADEYIEHHHSHHGINLKSNSVASVPHTEDQNENDGNQVTILNEDGEPVGIATNEDENSNASNGGNGNHPQKRRGTRMSIETPAKRIIRAHQQTQQRHHHQSRQRNEIDIDVTELDCIKLRTKSNKNDNRQDEILQYLKRVDDKLDLIIKHFNVPFHPSSHENTNYNLRNGRSSITSNGRPSMASTSPVANHSIPFPRINFQTTKPSSSSRSYSSSFYTTSDNTTTIHGENGPQEITQYVISDELLESTFLSSRNRGNFAKKLVYAAFPLEERLGRNCYGRKGGSLSGPKEPLEVAKLDAVREAVFRKFPVPASEEDAVWKKDCVIAIDSALRAEIRQRLQQDAKCDDGDDNFVKFLKH